MFHDQIQSFRQQYNDVFYALFRVLIGVLFICHGAQKLFGAFSDSGAQPLFSLMGAAGVIELVGGVLIALGLLTGVASAVCAATMICAFFIAHFTLGNPVPLVNRGELALVFLCAFIFILLAGGGRYSLDYTIWGENAAPEQVAAK
jgi:putative oxidoreductase